MADIQRSKFRSKWHHVVRRAAAPLPSTLRAALYRTLIDCDLQPVARLELKIAETQDELEACFRLLHDAGVAEGFMSPDASGLRVTPWHALPTTTTLCATYDGQVIGTVSVIRDGVFGFPMQSAFDLAHLRAKEGNIAQVSGLAVHPEFRGTGGAVLFPLMKFVRDYCVEYSDVRHLAVAVHPDSIDLYESVLFFERLHEQAVQHESLADAVPAIGATLDIRYAVELFKAGYRGRPPHKNLYKYFFQNRLANIKPPRRRYFTTNDPVMTPELLDYFFNQKTSVFATLDERRKSLLRSIYSAHPAFEPVLPSLHEPAPEIQPLRRHQRYSIRCPASVSFSEFDGGRTFVLNVIELSLCGFQAESKLELPVGADMAGQAVVELGRNEHSVVNVRLVRRKDTEQGAFFGFELDTPDPTWQRCVAALESGQTFSDLS